MRVVRQQHEIRDSLRETDEVGKQRAVYPVTMLENHFVAARSPRGDAIRANETRRKRKPDEVSLPRS